MLDHRRTQRCREDHFCFAVLTASRQLSQFYQRRRDPPFRRQRFAIAAGLSPLSPETALVTASRLFLREIENHIQSRQNFAFETTLSGRSYLKLIERLRTEGWRVELIYLALTDVEMSKMRVAERVAHGGHDIPTEAIKRRFSRSLRNLLNEFSQAVNWTECFMNTGSMPELIFIQEGENRQIVNPELFNQLIQQAQL